MGVKFYFLTFIDEIIGYMRIYFMEKKSEVFNPFKGFKLLVEKQVEYSIEKLRTDGGGEYTFNEFAQFREKEGIENENITPYTPKHNDIVERTNMSILNMEMSMLKVRQMKKKWGERASTVMNIINKCLTKNLMRKTPCKAWTSQQRPFQNLWITLFRRVPEQLRRKLDERSQTMILIGYHSTCAYKLFSPNKNKVVIIMDV